jgi:hypothetical protein
MSKARCSAPDAHDTRSRETKKLPAGLFLLLGSVAACPTLAAVQRVGRKA